VIASRETTRQMLRFFIEVMNLPADKDDESGK
jgi:hypothetical protein